MDIRELYESDLLDIAARRLQGQIMEGEDGDFQTVIEGPEIIPDELLTDWLAYNYVYMLDFTAEGTPVIGEIGGQVFSFPGYTGNDKSVLSISEASMGRVFLTTDAINESREKGDKNILNSAEKDLETSTEERNGIIVINGNVNIAHYDFTSCAGMETPTDMIRTNAYLLLGAKGVIVLSEKQLPGEHYVLGVPANPRLFEELVKIEYKNNADVWAERKFEVLRKRKDAITPVGMVAGFHIKYEGHRAMPLPVIGKREAEKHSKYLSGRGCEPFQSRVGYLGVTHSDGSCGIKKRLIT